jgi:hypothetical protein
VHTRSNFNDFVRVIQPVVQRIREAMEEGTTQVAMRLGATLWKCGDQTDGLVKIFEKLLTQVASRAFVPGVGLGDIVISEGREADVPGHRWERRALAFTSSQDRDACSVGSPSRSSRI